MAPPGSSLVCGGWQSIGKTSANSLPSQPPAPKDRLPPTVSNPTPSSVTARERAASCPSVNDQRGTLDSTTKSNPAKYDKSAPAASGDCWETSNPEARNASASGPAASGLVSRRRTRPSPSTNVSAVPTLFSGRSMDWEEDGSNTARQETVPPPSKF